MNVAIVSTNVPRRCGIATFSHDLIMAMKTAETRVRSRVAAIDEPNTLRAYESYVRWRITQGDPKSYIAAAREISTSNADVVNIQHEFGLYGIWRESNGEGYEDHLLGFLQNVDKPVVTTMHTVIPEPSQHLINIVSEIAEHSNQLVVMSHTAAGMLRNDYNVKSDITVVPHGVPTIEPKGRRRLKSKLGLQDRNVVLTFGLVDPRKGLEYVIRAMPDVVSQHPDALYLIAGQTHPELLRTQGENYRNSLLDLVNELGLEEHVAFLDQFMTQRDIIECLLTSDVYVTPYLDANQITSGTLSYALGAGKAIISTKYLHALEALENDRGILVDFRNPKQIADSINAVLGDPDLKARLEKNAFEYGREMTWPRFASRMAEVLAQTVERTHPSFRERRGTDRPVDINLGERVASRPIVTASDVTPSNPGLEVVSAFNAAATKVGDETLLLMRVAERPRTDLDPAEDAKTLDFSYSEPRLVPLGAGMGREKVVSTMFLNTELEKPKIEIIYFPRDLPGLDLSDRRTIRYRNTVGGFGNPRDEFSDYLTQMSHLRIARSTDGVTFRVDEKPALEAAQLNEEYGVEDARITLIDGTYYITYVAVSRLGMATSLATTKDFKKFERHGMIMLPDNKDVTIFPEKINGKYAALSRPMPPSFGHIHGIWIAYSDDLLTWGDHRPLALPRAGKWDELRTGASCVPFKTKEGWIEIYHGVDRNSRYCLGALLLDAKDPTKILARSDRPIFVPTLAWERSGLFNEAVFSCGHVSLDAKNEKVRVYYGAADSCTGAADFSVKDILGSMEPCSDS